MSLRCDHNVGCVYVRKDGRACVYVNVCVMHPSFILLSSARTPTSARKNRMLVCAFTAVTVCARVIPSFTSGGSRTRER